MDRHSRLARSTAARALNHIAHFLLAPHTDAGAAGTLLADFHRGAIGDDLDPEVAHAVALHRAIDGHVDRHPIVSEARALFAPAHRRYSGVALDLYFDHCLVREWPMHASTGFDAFIDAIYRRLAAAVAAGTLPEHTHRFTRAMIGDDWLRGLATFDGVEAALGRLNYAIRRRFGREVDLTPLAAELARLDAALSPSFGPLFADLRHFVGTRAISTGRS